MRTLPSKKQLEYSAQITRYAEKERGRGDNKGRGVRSTGSSQTPGWERAKRVQDKAAAKADRSRGKENTTW